MHPFRLIPPLPPGQFGDTGYIGADSTVWYVARERALLLGGATALLLQVAHPLLGAAVNERSYFETDPLKRLVGTLNGVLVTAFGNKAQARAMAKAVAAKHRPVYGQLSHTVGEWHQGTPYNAKDPELAMWVYATLIEVALDTYSSFVHPLTPAARRYYYEESEPFGKLFGVTDSVRPRTYTEFCDYYDKMVGRLAVGDDARQVASGIFGAKLKGIPVSPMAQILASGLLPSKLAAEYGIAAGPGYEKVFQLVSAGTRTVLHVTPQHLRYWQHYRAGMARHNR